MKIVKLKEPMTWYEVEKFLFKHKNVELLNDDFYMLKKDNEEETYWLPKIYAEFSSFGFIWDSNKKIKLKQRKDTKHKITVRIKDK